MANSEEDIRWLMERFHTTREDALTAPDGIRAALHDEAIRGPIVPTPEEVAHGSRLAAGLVIGKLRGRALTRIKPVQH